MIFPQADVYRGALRELFLAMGKKFKLTPERCRNSKIHFLMIAQKIPVCNDHRDSFGSMVTFLLTKYTTT